MWFLYLVAPVRARDLPKLPPTETVDPTYTPANHQHSADPTSTEVIFRTSGEDAADTKGKPRASHVWAKLDLETCDSCHDFLPKGFEEVGLHVFPGEVALLFMKMHYFADSDRTDEGRRRAELACHGYIAGLLAWLHCYGRQHSAVGTSKGASNALWVSRTLVRVGCPDKTPGPLSDEEAEIFRWWLDAQALQMLPYDGYDGASYFFQYGNNAIDLPCGWCSDWATMSRVFLQMQFFSAEQALLRRELAGLYDELQAISLSDMPSIRDQDIDQGIHESERLMGRSERLRLWFDDYLMNMQADRGYASRLIDAYLIGAAFESQERSAQNISRVLSTVRIQSQYRVDRRRQRWENLMNALLATIGAIAIFDILLNLVWFTTSEEDIRLSPPYGILYLVTQAPSEIVVLAGALLVVVVGAVAYLLGKWIAGR